MEPRPPITAMENTTSPYDGSNVLKATAPSSTA